MKRFAIIHHDGDLDGLMSGTIATKVFETIFVNSNENFTYDIIGYNYGKDPIKDSWLDVGSFMEPYTHYQFIDVTPPLSWLKENQDLIISGKINVTIFDHHENAYVEIFKELPNIVASINFSYFYTKDYCGALIYNNSLFFSSGNWIEKFFPDEDENHNIQTELKYILHEKEFKKLLHNVDSYDTWKWKNVESEENINWFALAINEYFLQFKDVNDYYYAIFEETYRFMTFVNKGMDIINFKQNQSKMNKHLICDNIHMNKVCIINAKANTYDVENVNEKINSEDFPEYQNIKCILFYQSLDFINDKINISLRTLNQESKFDCNKFIKLITSGNGGGHQAASGGQMSIMDFVNLVQLNNN